MALQSALHGGKNKRIWETEKIALVLCDGWCWLSVSAPSAAKFQVESHRQQAIDGYRCAQENIKWHCESNDSTCDLHHWSLLSMLHVQFRFQILCTGNFGLVVLGKRYMLDSSKYGIHRWSLLIYQTQFSSQVITWKLRSWNLRDIARVLMGMSRNDGALIEFWFAWHALPSSVPVTLLFYIVSVLSEAIIDATLAAVGALVLCFQKVILVGSST